PALLGHPRERKRKARANVGDAQLVGGEGSLIGDQDGGNKEKKNRSSKKLGHRHPKNGSRNHSLSSLAFGRTLELIADATLGVQAIIVDQMRAPDCVILARGIRERSLSFLIRFDRYKHRCNESSQGRI